MKPPLLLWAVAAAVIAAVAFFTGRSLRPEGDAGYAFTTEAAAYEAAASPAGLSRGGFSGFGETGGIEGRTVLAGRVAEVSSTSLTIETEAGPATVRLTGDQRLRRLESGGRDLLRPGATIAVRRGADSSVEAVLVIAPP